VEEAEEVQQNVAARGDENVFPWLSSWDIFMAEPPLHALRMGIIWWLTSTSLEFTLYAALHVLLVTLACVIAKFLAGTWRVKLTEECLEWKAFFFRKRLNWSDISSIHESQKYGLSLAVQTSSRMINLPVYGIADLSGLRRALREKGCLKPASSASELKLKYSFPLAAYASLIIIAIFLPFFYPTQKPVPHELVWLYPLFILPFISFYPLTPKSRHFLQIKDNEIRKIEFFSFKTRIRLDEPFILTLDEEKLVIKRDRGTVSFDSDITIPRTTAKFDEILSLLESKQDALKRQDPALGDIRQELA
jgi:hypothetical protein